MPQNTDPQDTLPDFDPLALPVPPYGEDVFTEYARGKAFTTLHFRHGGGDQAALLTWIGAILDELTAESLPPSARVVIELTPDPARRTAAGPKFRGHMKVPVDLAP